MQSMKREREKPNVVGEFNLDQECEKLLEEGHFHQTLKSVMGRVPYGVFWKRAVVLGGH